MTGRKITLGEVVAADAQVRVYCDACGRTVVLPVAALVRRHGAAFRLDEIERKARCVKCGSRQIDARPEYPRAVGAGGMS